jgi:membrane-bound lytic murein transglycosylase A
VSFAELPGWQGTDAQAALGAFRRSCALFAREAPSTALGGAGYGGSVADWRAACAAAPAGNIAASAARSYFESTFTAFEIASYGSARALFTGYYEPQLRVSRVRHGPYAAPIYGLPEDLVTVDLGRFRNSLKSEHIAGRVMGHVLVPYYTRAEIDAHGLKSAPVLAYADDPITVFFLEIQGSGRAVLDDGHVVRLAYAGQNGRPYTPIGRTLIEQGAIAAERMSMQAIRQWLLGHPTDARAVMESDQSFVFFREAALGEPGLGSEGSEGTPLAPGASIAVDSQIHPLGIPFFIAASVPDPDPSRPDNRLNRLFIAQDTGGAIRGATRADVFWGFGPVAEAIAGRMKSTGRLYVLLPKELASRVAHANFTSP